MPQVVLNVRLQYSDGELLQAEACDLLQTAIEDARQAGKLSDPAWMDDPARPELTCDWVTVTPAKEEPSDPGEEEATYLAHAQNVFQKDGDLEFDDNAVVSISEDGGAYVQCWKWIDRSDVKLPGDEE